MPLQVLDKTMRPAFKLLSHCFEVMRLDRITNRLGDEPHFVPSFIERPGQIHIFRQSPPRPSAAVSKLFRSVHGKASRRDDWFFVVILNLLVERECEQIFDVSSAFPDRTDVTRND